MKRLSQPTGAVIGSDAKSSDAIDKIVRPAIVVHAGPESSEIEFQSGDGPIKFDADRIQRVIDVHNKKLSSLAEQYGGEDKIPLGAYEPLLDQHSDDSGDRVIGRLTGKLKYEVRDVPKVGKNVPCAVAEGITFIGEENVKRVQDGRIYHLSIGINEADDSLGELSSVIQPAAAGAMLLSKTTKTINGGLKMPNDLTKLKALHADRMTKLAALKETFQSTNKKLTSTQNLMRLNTRKSEITKRLSRLVQGMKMTPAELKNLLGGDKLTKLAGLNDDGLNMVVGAYESREVPVIKPGQIGSSNATEFFSDITKTVNANSGKREFKRLRSEIASDFKKLSGKKLIDSEDEKSEMGSGAKEESLNPSSDPHAVPGQAGAEQQLKHMWHKMRMHLESGDIDKAKEAHAEMGKHLESKMSGPKEEPVNPGKDKQVVPDQAGDEEQLKHMYGEMGKHLAEGDIEKAKEEHKKMGKHCGAEEKQLAEYSGDVQSADQQKGMQDLQKQVDELNTQLARMAGMVEELIGAEQKEGEAFSEIGGEHEALPAKQ